MADIATLDTIDRRILTLLQQDGSLSVAELADRLGMTPPPCWRRVRRLKDAGILKRQIWEVDAAAVGMNVTVYATLKLNAHDARATSEFREQIRLLPEVLECYILLGSVDVIVKMIVSDIKYYEQFFYERLSQLPGVREVNSSVVLTEVKKTAHIPV